MLKSIKNFLLISALGISACIRVYATEKDDQLLGTILPSTLQQPQEDTEYTPFMKGLYEEQNWDEIISNADRAQTIIKDSFGKTMQLTYDTVNIIGQAYWHTKRYKEGMFYFDKLTGLLSERDKENPAVMGIAYKAIGLNTNDQTMVPLTVLAIAHAWMGTLLWETMYDDMQKKPNIASALKAKHNWQVIENFRLAFSYFRKVGSFFNTTAAYFYLANGMYKEASEQFTHAIEKLKEEGGEPSENLINDAIEAHEKAQNAIQTPTTQTTENTQLDSLKLALETLPLTEIASSTTIAQPQQEAANSKAVIYNIIIQDLYDNKKWNEIIQAATRIRTNTRNKTLEDIENFNTGKTPNFSLTTPINHQNTIFSNLSRKTFANIGEAYLNIDLMEGIKFFMYCKGLYPAVVNFSPDVLEEISGWLNTYLLKTKENTPLVNQKEDVALSEITTGNNFMTQQNYQAAVVQYDAAIKKINEAQKPVTSSLLEMAGLANYQVQNYAKALNYYKQAKEAAPSNKFQFAQNYIYLGQCYYMVGEKQKSLKEFKQGLEENPNETALAYIAAAQPAMDLNEWGIAADWLKKAITKDDNQTANTYADAGLSFLMIEDNKQALEYLNKALELNPGLPQRVYNRRDMAQLRLHQMN